MIKFAVRSRVGRVLNILRMQASAQSNLKSRYESLNSQLAVSTRENFLSPIISLVYTRFDSLAPIVS